MSKDVLEESIVTEAAEPITPDELIAHLVQDIVAGSSPDELADEFIDSFILQDRAETGQILSLLEMPSESLVGMLKGVVGQSYQASVAALDSGGVKFLEGLKAEVKKRMTELASDTA